MTRDKMWVSRLRLIALPVIVIVALVAAWRLGYFDLDRRQQFGHAVEHIQRWPWVETAYVIGYALTLALCFPAAIATTLGGALFGVWKGALLAWVGSLVGTVLAHALAKYVARAPLKRVFGEHRLLRELKDHDSVAALLRLRLLPVAPFAVLDYVAGVAGASLLRLILATMVGIIPSVLAYAYVGAELMKGFVSRTQASHRALWIAGVITLVMFALSAIPSLVRKLRN